MILKDISFARAQENVAYDQTILELAEAGSSGEVLRFWESREYFIVLGRTSKSEEDVNLVKIKRDGLKIARRISGGGTVLQGPGCLNYSLVLNYERSPLLKNIRSSYDFILGYVINSLRKLGIEARHEGLSDLVIGEMKFSGNAQCRRKKYLLHHGTILYNFNIERIEEYVNVPCQEPAYRQRRSHRDFLTNIEVKSGDIKKAIAKAWIDKYSCVESGGILLTLPGRT